MDRPIIIALDFPDIDNVRRFLQAFDSEQLYVKVGMELFYKEGLSIISYLKEKEHRIFLDLKLHDIPNTVKNGMKSLASLGVDMVNVHAAGGKKMMEAALEGLESGTPQGMSRPLCIAVTQLTSTSEQMLREELLIEAPLEQTVVQYAKHAKESGLDGVVCSTLEAKSITAACGETFLKVTPGIRLPEDDVNDQVRVATPELAKKLGASAIVVGRSITKADDPLKAYHLIKQEWEG